MQERRNNMTKEEYIVTKYWCYVRCTPIEDKCKCCSILKYYKELGIARKTITA